MLADGKQRINFKTTTAPTTAVISWLDNKSSVSRNFPVSYDAASAEYFIQELIPAEEFTVKLSTEVKIMKFQGEWGDAVPKDYAELEYEIFSNLDLKVPYCDLSALTVSFRTITEVPLETWSDFNKKSWSLRNIEVEDLYGAPTLIATISVPLYLWTKQSDGVNWTRLNHSESVIVELGNHSRITTDRIVNRTICRDSLYGKQWRRVVEL